MISLKIRISLWIHTNSYDSYVHLIEPGWLSCHLPIPTALSTCTWSWGSGDRRDHHDPKSSLTWSDFGIFWSFHELPLTSVLLHTSTMLQSCSTLVYIHTAYRIMAHSGIAETANPSTCCWSPSPSKGLGRKHQSGACLPNMRDLPRQCTVDFT